MNRLEALREQGRLFPDNETLPEICLALRAGVNGSADPWGEDTVTATLAMLRARLGAWQEGRGRTRRLDEAVRELVLATVEEVEGYRDG